MTTAIHLEIWKAIPGFEGSYEVSDQGRVRSLARRIPTVCKGRATTRLVPARILKPGRKPSGHVSVALTRKGGSHDLHVLVLTAFAGSKPIGMEACHNDGDPSNNVLSNLRWDTRTNNILDAVKSGTWYSDKRKAWIARIGIKNHEHLKRASKIRWDKHRANRNSS